MLRRVLRRLGLRRRDQHWARVQSHLDQLYEAHANHEERIRRIESISALAAWIDQATLRANPLVSVVMPTRNRAELLPRAIGSVRAQTYPNWELIVVDDGSTDGTGEFLAGVDDERIRGLTVEHGGGAAARNRGLAEARGELIAYLDDDNALHPRWLKSVAWAFEQRPEVDVLYGAWVIDNPSRLNPSAELFTRRMPELWFTPWDRSLLLKQPLVDQSAIAHRTGLAEAHFDEDLQGYSDCVLLARLTLGREPLALPAIACVYSTGAVTRLSSGTENDAQREAARVRVHALHAGG